MKKSVVTVTDHAVLRYLERVKGMDIDAVRRDIGRLVDLACDHPDATGIVIDGWSYKLRNGHVTTVAPRCRPGRGKGRVKS